jgi:putative RecB family exonuclease
VLGKLATMDDLPPFSSASQLVAYASCPRKFFFRYVMGLEPETKSLALAFGSAMHGAIGWWFEEKLAGRSPSLAAAERVFAADLAAHASQDDIDRSELVEAEEDGLALLRVYLQQYGDLPVARVEQPFEVDLADPSTGEVLRPLKGYFDLVLDSGTVIELKTSSRKWSEPEVQRHLQLGAYSYVAARSCTSPVLLEVHVLVRRKRTPGVETYSYARTGWWLPAALAIERAIQSRLYPPSPGPMCSGCEYAQACASQCAASTEGRHPLPTPP